jgi:hypothetical protein
VTQKPAVVHKTPVPESRTQRTDQRDTLTDTPELRFLRDEIEALLGSPTVRRSLHVPTIRYAEDHEAIAPERLGKEWLERATESESSPSESESLPEGELAALDSDEIAEPEPATAELEEDDDIYERDTEPSIDVQLLREAVRVAGK